MDEPGLIGLLYGADWTRLSLAAETSDGSAVLVAPGKRYWHRTADYETGCDGTRAWELDTDEDDRGDADEVTWIGGPEPPLSRLLCPAWLLVGSRLEARGRVRACGREAIDVVMTHRHSSEADAGPVEVLVDADLGILLRVAGPGDDGEPEVTELVSADFGPVIDEGRFAPPPGSRMAQSLGEVDRSAGPAWQVAWVDVAAMASQVPAWARRAGFGGLGLLMDTVSELPARSHVVTAVRIAGPGRYQIDHASSRRRRPVSIACDGHRYWQVYADRVTTGPARPLPVDETRLADPSWLLEGRLAGGEAVTLDGRRAYRVSVAAGPRGLAGLLFRSAIAVIDAELGVILRLTSYLGTRPVERQELRDVSPDAGEFQVSIPPGLPVREDD